MKFKEYFDTISFLIQQKDYKHAFEIAIAEQTNFSNSEMEDFFYRDQFTIPSYGISGSGGSGIAKPNIGTLAAYHIARIFERNAVDGVVVKFGSRKKTSNFGSIDFGETITNKKFLLINEELFNLTLGYLKINASVAQFLKTHYVSSCFVRKKIIFCKSKDEALDLLTKDTNKTTIKTIHSRLFGKPFDEIIPEGYYTSSDPNVFEYKSEFFYYYSDYDLAIDMIPDLNVRLLLGNFSGAWGRVLRYTLIETITFFLDITFKAAEAYVDQYINSIKYLLVFDLDGTLLNKSNSLTKQTISMLYKLKSICDIAVNSGSNLSSVIQKCSGFKMDYYIANYGSVVLSKDDFEEYYFDAQSIFNILNSITYSSFKIVTALGIETSFSKAHKLQIKLVDRNQITKFSESVRYFFSEDHIELVPIPSKWRPIRYLQDKYKYTSIICIGDSENDIDMFNNSDFSYCIKPYIPKSIGLYKSIKNPHSDDWEKFQAHIKYILRGE